jgi:histidine triad (HIT) family protein
MDFYCEQVLTGQLPVQVVAETDDVLAFHHTQPYWPVHIVVIPKRHLTSLAHLEADGLAIAQEMLRVAAGICRDVTASQGGCRLSTNCGTSQSTPHLHFYIHHGPRLRNEDGSAVA